MDREQAIEVLKALRVISKEEDIAEGSILGQNALLGRMEIAQLLLAAGANVNGTDDKGFTALHQACMVNWPGQGDVVRWLIANGADISAHACNLGYPLHIAALNGCTEHIRVLHAAGADIHARNRAGATPLHTACVFGQVEAVRLLLELGADPAAKNNAGNTPAELAAAFGREDCAALCR